MGLGKTASIAGLVSMVKEAGELDRGDKILIVCRAPAIMQWEAELKRMLKDLEIQTATGTKKERIEKYMGSWDIMLIGPQMLINEVDDLVNHFPIKHLIVDDVDTLRNRNNKSAAAIKRIAKNCNRVVIVSGTPLQKRLPEMHSVLEPIGGRDVFGSEYKFKHRYIRSEKTPIWVGGKKRIIETAVAYKNIDEFIRLLQPFALRRTPDDVDDITMPAVTSNNIWLEFTPAQKTKYEELQKGVLKIIKKDGVDIKRAKILAQLIYGAMICTGLASIGEEDRPNTSCKLNWLEDKLVDGDLSDEKVVVFMNFKNSIRAMAKRLDNAGVGYGIIWGEQKDKNEREKVRQQFWNDPDCKVLIGSTSIEQSLNLQCARHLINVDTILNPARMAQLAGRVRRDGSTFKNVFVHNLLVRDSQEERYLPTLEREQALISTVWGEESPLFAKLDGLAMARLITG
jgi:SNF2 family DNA or RNA helicase